MTPAVAQEEIDDASQLAASCKNDDPVCVGYVKGFLAGHFAGQSGLRYCMPKGLTLGELIAAFQRRVANDPKAQGESTVIALSYTLFTDFPCK